jgi:xanthine dehydrogenase YagT iron-sulfur-binding subunit
VSLTGAKGPLTDGEIRERMAGNICRCGAYPNIIAAVRDVHQQTNAELAR